MAKDRLHNHSLTKSNWQKYSGFFQVALKQFLSREHERRCSNRTLCQKINKATLTNTSCINEPCRHGSWRVGFKQLFSMCQIWFCSFCFFFLVIVEWCHWGCSKNSSMWVIVPVKVTVTAPTETSQNEVPLFEARNEINRRKHGHRFTQENVHSNFQHRWWRSDQTHTEFCFMNSF